LHGKIKKSVLGYAYGMHGREMLQNFGGETEVKEEVRMSILKQEDVIKMDVQ
jgi:hypothetical protein